MPAFVTRSFAFASRARLLRRACGVFLLLLLTTLLPLIGCGESGKPELLLYSDQDKSVVEPLLENWRRQQNIPIRVVYAAAKDVRGGEGLAARVREESESPKADLYWAGNVETMQKLQADNLLEAYHSPPTDRIADDYRDRDAYWFGLGARARVLIYNTRLVRAAQAPRSLAALARPEWKGKAALADPRVNAMAAYHLLTAFTLLKETEGTRLLERIQANGVQFLPDEAAVVAAVASGKAAWGVVDSDLAQQAMQTKAPLEFVVADQANFSTSDALGVERGMVATLGTPIIAAPVAIIKSSAHAADKRKLLDYLCSTQTALKLQEVQPARFPTHQDLLRSKPETGLPHPLYLPDLRASLADAGVMNTLRPRFTLVLDKIFATPNP